MINTFVTVFSYCCPTWLRLQLVCNDFNSQSMGLRGPEPRPMEVDCLNSSLWPCKSGWGICHHHFGWVWHPRNQLKFLVYLPLSHSHEFSKIMVTIFAWKWTGLQSFKGYFSLTLKNLESPGPMKAKTYMPEGCHYDGLTLGKLLNSKLSLCFSLGSWERDLKFGMWGYAY